MGAQAVDRCYLIQPYDAVRSEVRVVGEAVHPLHVLQQEMVQGEEGAAQWVQQGATLVMDRAEEGEHQWRNGLEDERAVLAQVKAKD